jgi:hypothetical protein
MKYLIKNFILSFGILFISGCETENNYDRYPHYQFNNDDEKLIINYNYTTDQIITYRNQFNEELNFKVISNERKKSRYFVGATFSGGGTLRNYYDSKIIRMEILENQNYEDNGLINYVFSKNSDNLKNGVNFPMWNIPDFTFIDEIQNPTNIIITDFNNQAKTQMTINNHLFENVVIIESGSDDEYLNSSYGTIIKNVNMILYDYDFGVIQFNDIEGKEWKLIYPE